MLEDKYHTLKTKTNTPSNQSKWIFQDKFLIGLMLVVINQGNKGLY